jgi:hypothetical protein
MEPKANLKVVSFILRYSPIFRIGIAIGILPAADMRLLCADAGQTDREKGIHVCRVTITLDSSSVLFTF